MIPEIGNRHQVVTFTLKVFHTRIDNRLRSKTIQIGMIAFQRPVKIINILYRFFPRQRLGRKTD